MVFVEGPSPKDVPKLKAIGIQEVFGAEARFDDIVHSIKTHVG